MTKQFSLLYTCLCPFLLYGCATIPNTLSSTSKYFQFRHPIKDVVVMQIILPNEKACQSWKKGVTFEIEKIYGEEFIKSSNIFSCANETASDNLPYQATIRDKVFDYLFDMEFLSPNVCGYFLDQMKEKDGSKDSLEIVSNCNRK